MMLATKTGISERLALFGQQLFGSARGWKTEFAKALTISPQQLNDYLSGRWLPGNKMEERLRKLGCDVVWLMTGERQEEINHQFEEMIERRAKEAITREDRAMLTVLHGLGITNTTDLAIALDMERTPNVMNVLKAAEEPAKYNAQKKGRKRNG